MTNPTTNEQIALALGWTRFMTDFGGSELRQHGWHAPPPWPGGDKWHWSPPDFEHEWVHAGPLWGELVRELGMAAAYHRVSNQLTNNRRIASDEELMEAIAGAWLAWQKEEGKHERA